MSLEFGKVVKAATLPIVVLLLLSLLQNVLRAVIGLIPIIGALGWLLYPVHVLLVCVVLVWAGHRAVKAAGMDLVGGAVTGAFSGLVIGLADGIIGFAINFILNILGMGVGVVASQDASTALVSLLGGAFGTAFMAAIGVLCIFVLPVLGIVAGAICGAIGAVVAGAK